jgi:hypothetical protein
VLGTQTSILSLLRENLRRAIVIAAVVGSALVLINHGDHIEREPLCDHFFTKTGLSYLVPFLVSMVSAVLAGLEKRHPR